MWPNWKDRQGGPGKRLKSVFRVLKRDQNLNRGPRIMHIQVVLSKVWVLLLTHCDVGVSLILQNCVKFLSER